MGRMLRAINKELLQHIELNKRRSQQNVDALNIKLELLANHIGLDIIPNPFIHHPEWIVVSKRSDNNSKDVPNG